jgi:hypothetical protein
MLQSHNSASSSQTAELPTFAPLLPPLRREELTAEVAGLICEVIKAEGIADHLAGALMGVSRDLFTRWRAEDEAFAMGLEQARAWFELGLMREIRKARKSNGTPDWRAQAWLLKHATAEGFAKPARAAQERPAQKRANLPETPAARPGAAPAPAERRAPTRENTSILPETRHAGGLQKAA